MKNFIISICLAFISTFSAYSEKPKVGFSLPLSGIVAGMGEGFRRGIELYKNENPQISFEIVLDDHRYDGKQVVSSYQKLRNVDKADVIVVWGNQPSDVAAPIAQRDKQQLIAVSSQPVAKGRNTVLEFGFKIDDLSRTIAEYVLANHFKNYGALWINIGNVREGIDLIKKHIAIEDYAVDSSGADFVPQILRLKKSKVDGLLLFLLPESALTYAAQAKNLHFAVPTLGGDIFADDEFQKKIAPLIPELSIIYGGAKSDFIEKLKSTFKLSSYYFESASAYSIMKLLDGYYRKETRKGINDYVSNLDLVGQNLPVEDLRYSNTAEHGALLGCQFKITRAIH